MDINDLNDEQPIEAAAEKRKAADTDIEATFGAI